MGVETRIEWADYTFSPWEVCVKVNDGCRFYYAEPNNMRWRGGKHWGPGGSRRVMSEAAWRRVVGWNAKALGDGRYRRIFPSICDPFEAYQGAMVNSKGEVQDVMMDDVRKRFFKLVDDTPGLFWMLLTKRPENVVDMAPPHWMVKPPANVMICASASDQKTTEQMLVGLVEWPGYKGLSLEPLLNSIVLWGMKGIDALDWVVIGGESGVSARGCNVWWVRMLVSDCLGVGVPVYVKQFGSRPFRLIDDCRLVWPVGTAKGVNYPKGRTYFQLKHKKGGDPKEWPTSLRVREYPEFMVGSRKDTKATKNCIGVDG